MTYQKLDSQILEAIENGVVTFNVLIHHLGMAGDRDWRKVDRRLQSLRRRGIIRFRRGVPGLTPHWEIV